jgi:glucose-1-phosphate adenylyltransferase
MTRAMPHLDLKNSLAFILAGGEGSRLKPLTQQRAKPAVPFGGCYRIIDFTLSNCIHSGLRRINLLTQYQARSLEEHVRFGWNFLPRRLEQFITCRAPHHVEVGRWYRGTADAIYHNLDAIEDWNPSHVLILSGDHIYHMDYRDMISMHVCMGAALTIGAVKIRKEEASRFGILQCDKEGRVTGFQEKPKSNPAEIPGQPGWCLASMGIYVFDPKELVKRLHEDAAMPEGQRGDFGQHVIPRMLSESPIYAHTYVGLDGETDPYWRDVGTIEAFFEANMDLCAVRPKLNLYRRDWPTYTLWHNDPPAKTVLDEEGRRAEVRDTLLCPPRHPLQRGDGGRGIGTRGVHRDARRQHRPQLQAEARDHRQVEPRAGRHRDRPRPRGGPQALPRERNRDRGRAQGPRLLRREVTQQAPCAAAGSHTVTGP